MNETMKTNTNPEVTGRLVRGAQRAARATPVVLAMATLAGCEVENPGLVEDKFLSESVAYDALVHGAAADLALSLNWEQLLTGHAAREIFSTGQGGPGGVGAINGAGFIDPDDSGSEWADAQSGRWIAENALERFANPDNEAPTTVVHVQAYLWAGYANERLGEHFCEAVFDGGPKEPNIRYFERAEQHFTDAIAMASGEQLTAAYAGRAQARVYLEKWSGAVSDAERVPLDFVYELPADIIGGGSRELRNLVYDGNANLPHRAQSIHHTWFYDYYLETGDPRSAWADDPAFPFGLQTMPGYPGGSVPWSFTIKYTSLVDPFRLASGREMVLIRAEALLAAGDWPQAMTLINDIRTATSRPSPRADEETESLVSHTTGQPLDPWPASSIEEAWTALKRERAVEMWLESRRMGDLRRWRENNVPGEIDFPDWESISFHFADLPPGDCLPVPESEIDTNVNF
jgi:hypothetical protein